MRIQGVPIQLWDKEVFEKIAQRYGKNLHGSAARLGDGVLSFDTVAIKVKTGEKICDSFMLEWNYLSARIWVSKDDGMWVPSFLDTKPSP